MFEWLETTPPAIWVGESLWGYPIMLGLHVVGLAIVAGIFILRDLRLLGMFDGISYPAMTALYPLAWSGFVINALSGSFLFSSQASLFVESTPFLTKISLIFTAVVCAAFLQRRMSAAAANWDAAHSGPPPSARGVAIVSLLCWIGAIVAGRLIAYL